MSAALQYGALVCTVLGLLAGGAVAVRARDGRTGLSVLLDFLLAAGLLRLSADLSWRQVAAAGAVVAVRRLVARDLRRA